LSPAERQRASRRRRKLGIFKVEVDVTPELRSVLVDAGRLRAWDEDDRAAVQAAIQQIADEMSVTP
jgi:hypothetical protein